MSATAMSTALEHPAFTELDRQFGRFIARLSPASDAALALGAALVSHQRGLGHSCLDLARLAGRPFPDDDPGAETPPLLLPELEPWRRVLAGSGVVGRPGDFTPLVLDQRHRLYLHRYWQYETELAQAILRRVRTDPGSAEAADLVPIVDRYFPAATGEDAGGQKQAVMAASQRRFCVISGGPGTGKTHTVAVLLAVLLEQAGQQNGKRPLRIILTAPTGKAAARLQETMRNLRAALPCPEVIREQLPQRASTVHRVLGVTPDSIRPRHHAANPLPADVVVVDEASMLDLALMAKLFAAMPPNARIVLLGDPDQLASVEAGAVLGDICQGGPGRPELTASLVRLQRNFRFGLDNGIHRLSRAINDGDTRLVLRLLRGEETTPGAGIGGVGLPSAEQLKTALRAPVLAGFRGLFESKDPGNALRALAGFRILCALRQGPYGVGNINRLTVEILREAGLIPTRDPWYAGRPILITRNDYPLKLFNGDVGIVLPDPVTGQPQAWFPGADGTPRRVSPSRLPAHETVFAMTVHKSQGSEFDEVLLVLPDRINPVLTRELVYTGVTRSSRRVEVWFDENMLTTTLGRTVQRGSGLRDALWGGGALGIEY